MFFYDKKNARKIGRPIKDENPTLEGDHYRNVMALNSWKNLPGHLHLVHALNLFANTESPLLEQNASELLSTWDAISTSLIDIRDRKTMFARTSISEIAQTVKNFSGSASKPELTSELSIKNEKQYYSKSENITYGEIAFVLDFSPSNIIGTFPSDVWFPNHVGLEKSNPIERSSALSKAIFNGESEGNRATLPKGTYVDVMPYQELLDKSKELRRQYNEVILMGKGGISLHPTMPASKAIKVKEIIILPRREVRWANGKPHYNQTLTQAVDKLIKNNPSIKISVM
ncbi:hypothetical protein [Serratia marcescens]|uniref:hypothetical protein n=1 Tax=Serratia marcescens TaxID=615 RepID=UPI000AF50C74|nr:hypothetical protein [Serratia marcescens]UJA52124.1 hypothetical protein L1F17_13940 [Serratia marcescens]